jgi:ATP-independent RNA helicase DbpA
MTPDDSSGFDALPLKEGLLANLITLGYDRMTPIQAQGLPLVLKGKDLIARAKTGSGKTATFGLGVLQKLDPQSLAVQALVLCPTRELADQVGKEMRRLAQGIPNVRLLTLTGGKPIGPQKASLQHGAHIVVGTPGRILDHLQRNTLKLERLETLVLDEADRMLDMGFEEAVSDIVAATPRKRQTLLFSATYPDEIARISRRVQHQPVTVSVETTHEPGVIEQIFYQVSKHERHNALIRLFEHYQPSSALVFCRTRAQCAEVAALLNDRGISARAIHGELDQRRRDEVLALFANGSCPVMVATDVAARGLDIRSLPMVINYELPHDPEIYTHRIGRTGRAGESGLAVSLFLEGERARLNSIEADTGTPCIEDVPASLDPHPGYQLNATMETIELDAGRKQKLRPGDVLGALTGEAGLSGDVVGKIDIFDWSTLVALQRGSARKALAYFASGKIKGRRVKARRLR